MSKIPVSVVVMTKNEERNIAKCLKALADFDEVFVVDSNTVSYTHLDVYKRQALATVTALGALDETIQSFFAYRQADLLDLLADISAAGATVISLNIGSAAFGSFRAVTKS